MLGYCKYPIVQVRLANNHRSEIVTQMLFNETYQITQKDENEEWYYVTLNDDSYQGWIDAKLHSSLETKNSLTTTATHITTEVCKIKSQETSMYLPAGCTLNMHENHQLFIEDVCYTLNGIVKKIYSLPFDANMVLALAKTYLGTPYMWGGKTHFGIDCSGFVQQVFKIAGISIARDAYAQAAYGKTIDSIDTILPGDLAFFKNKEDKIVHVGIIADDNEIIHAHGEVRIDILDEKGIFNKKKLKYSHELSIIKRIIEL